jgi:hypothetical protein
MSDSEGIATGEFLAMKLVEHVLDEAQIDLEPEEIPPLAEHVALSLRGRRTRKRPAFDYLDSTWEPSRALAWIERTDEIDGSF